MGYSVAKSEIIYDVDRLGEAEKQKAIDAVLSRSVKRNATELIFNNE